MGMKLTRNRDLPGSRAMRNIVYHRYHGSVSALPAPPTLVITLRDFTSYHSDAVKFRNRLEKQFAPRDRMNGEIGYRGVMTDRERRPGNRLPLKPLGTVTPWREVLRVLL